ncbi:MAG: PAC2 family protein, partial [Candidatus Omnitrophica bacterium]|nr:PAC2 family protein [Candidatus Omnitrophota bacterium]
QSAVLDAVAVEDGIAHFQKPPANTFYYIKNPEIVIFEGELQLPGQFGINLLERVLDLALAYNIKRIFTGAAFPLPISHKQHPEVYGAANRDQAKELFKKFRIKAMEGGHISGLNGLMLGFAEKRNIEAVCLLATMPQYAIGLPNPKASLAIIEALSGIFGFKMDLSELGQYIKEMDEKMALIEDKVKDVFAIEEERHEPYHSDKKIPGYVMERVEKLFQEARHDKSKAITLKKELDRWDLYKVYEDRFLDLFKNNQ